MHIKYRITAEVLRERSGLTRDLPIGCICTQLWFPVCGTTKYNKQRKATVFFFKLRKIMFSILFSNVLWFTCIERALNGFLDIQDACTAPQIINKWFRSLHLL